MHEHAQTCADTIAALPHLARVRRIRNRDNLARNVHAAALAKALYMRLNGPAHGKPGGNSLGGAGEFAPVKPRRYLREEEADTPGSAAEAFRRVLPLGNQVRTTRTASHKRGLAKSPGILQRRQRKSGAPEKTYVHMSAAKNVSYCTFRYRPRQTGRLLRNVFH